MGKDFDYKRASANKDLPPLPPDGARGLGLNANSNHSNYRNFIDNGEEDDDGDFNFVDPNTRIDNSNKYNSNSIYNTDNLSTNGNGGVNNITNPNLSLNNRIIYDYDDDDENQFDSINYNQGNKNGDYQYGNPVGFNARNSTTNGNKSNYYNGEERQLVRKPSAGSNNFYASSNLSRQTSTNSNPFKEDPFQDGSKRNSERAFNRYSNFENNNDSFDNVQFNNNGSQNFSPDDANPSTSLLNSYRNNRFFNNKSRTVNGGFNVNDEFQPGELQPKPVIEQDKPNKITGFLVIRGRKIPIICWTFSFIQVIVFIAEIAKMGVLTGSPFQTSPYFNPMIGPSQYLQINMGSRFVSCMHDIPGVTTHTDSIFPCPNATNVYTGCTLDQLCGMSGLSQNANGWVPRQWYRLITPIFLHAGIIHIGCNLLLQLMLGPELEFKIGSLKFLIIYMASGISGNIFGANFAQDGLSSTGASGALFGIIGVNLFYFVFFTNRSQMHPRQYKKTLFFLIGEIIFTLILGLLPGLDNFSHIGGFVIGCLFSVMLLEDPNFVFHERYMYQRDPNHKKSAIPARNSLNSFTPFDYDGTQALGANQDPNVPNTSHQQKDPTFKAISVKVEKVFPNLGIRKSRIFFGWFMARVITGLLSFLWFYFLSVNFFRNGGGHCTWCKYLSCIPINDWCTMGTLDIENLSGSTSNSSLLIINLFTLLMGYHAKRIHFHIRKERANLT